MADFIGSVTWFNSLGGAYVQESGGNRLVVFLAVKNSGPCTAPTRVDWRGITRSPLVAIQGGDSGAVAIFVFKESELASGSTTFLCSDGAATAFDCYVFTLGDRDQSATPLSGYQAATTATPLIALAS